MAIEQGAFRSLVQVDVILRKAKRHGSTICKELACSEKCANYHFSPIFTSIPHIQLISGFILASCPLAILFSDHPRSFSTSKLLSLLFISLFVTKWEPRRPLIRSRLLTNPAIRTSKKDAPKSNSRQQT
jgi:hypothetical protein